MSQFEGIVRPWATPDTAPPQLYLTPGQASHPPVILNVQLNGPQVDSRMGQYTLTVTHYITKQQVEQTKAADS